jgi:cytochrome c oxidase assembly factor CtaG
MTTARLLLSAWTWEPEVLATCAVLLLAYLAADHYRLTWRTAAFAGGLCVILLALESPIDLLGDEYLFSIHMLQHLLLILIVPPLLLAGLPPRWLRQLLDWAPAGRLEAILGRPGVAWTLGMGTLWAWHLPVLYNAALRDEAIHLIEHLTFLVSATIFWWPVIAQPQEPWYTAQHVPSHARQHLAYPGMAIYLFTAAIANATLGIILTFAPVGLYPAYLHPADTLGILPLIRGVWGLTPQADQQLGGLLMWIPGGLVFLCAILGVLARWYSLPDDDALPEGFRQPARLPEQSPATQFPPRIK